MTFTEKKLGQTQPTSTSNVTLFTATTRTVVKSIRICNTTSSDAKFKLYVVDSGDSASVSNAIYYDLNIPNNQTIGDDGYLVLENGDSIVVQTETANTITFTINGAEL